MNVNPSDAKELLNTFFEGVIGLVVLIGAGVMINNHPESTAIIGIASAAATGVITFFFGQRGQVKAVNGNIAALANIARQMTASQGPTLVSATPLTVIPGGKTTDPAPTNA